MARGLEGIKVVDLSQVIAVPQAARHLADFGADVIHVENPATGDFFRYYQAGQGGTDGVPSDINYGWEVYNRNKRSVTLDVSQEIGQKILYKLVEKADVFVTNMRPFELENYHLTYDTLSQINSRLIYGAVNGYGKKGPERDAPAYDAIAYFARSGMPHVMSALGFRPGVGDNIAGLALAFGVMMALFIRERTGIGQEVDLSLFQAGTYQISFDIAGALVTGRDYEEWRYKSREEIPNALSLPYVTKDGRVLWLVMLQPDRYWSKICRAIGREDLEHDPRFELFQPRMDNHVELMHILDEVFASKTLDEWKVCLIEGGIPFSPFQNLVEVINDPQARANDFFVPFDHPTYGRMEVLANPVKLSKTPSSIRMPAPEFGQHTEEVLLEYGYSWEDVAQFKDKGVIA